MKAVLLMLSGDARAAQQEISQRYPQASIATISRTQFETLGAVARLKALRAHKPDVIAIATERLNWQRGQEFLFLLGALAGAREITILDAHGAAKSAKRFNVLLRSPVRIAGEAMLSASALKVSLRQLRRLERRLEQDKTSSREQRLPERHDKSSVEIVYMRATPGPGTHAGGAASHIKGVTDALAALGAQIRFISNDGIAGLDESTAALSIVEPQPKGFTRAIFEIHNNDVFTRAAVPMIERQPPDFIYQRYARFGWAGVVASLLTKRPLFLEYNGSEVWVGRHWDHVGMLGLLTRYERLNVTGATRIFVVSDVERGNLERAGVSPEKIIVNPNGVDTDVFHPGAGGAEVRRELGIRADDRLVGFAGSFGPWHGVLTLADAIKSIPASSGIRFLLIGHGALHSETEGLLQQEREQDRVIFTGAVAHDRMPALLDACDIVVSPHVPLADDTEFFGSPTKIFEYMSMGKAIVASRLGQLGDVLSHEKTALLVEPGNEQQLSAAILRLAESKDLRDELGAAARAAAIERHTWKRNAQTVLDAYRDWLGGAS